MMSPGWNWFVIIVTLANILGCWWLIIWAAKKRPGESEEGEVTGHVWDEDIEEYNNPMPRWWLMLFHLTIVFGLVYIVLYPGLGNYKGVLNWTQVGQYDDEAKAIREAQLKRFAELGNLSPAELVKNEQVLLTGSRLFAANCSTCHGSDAGGAVGYPSLNDSEWQYGGDYDTILQSISNGRTGVMPGWQAALQDDGVKEVTEFIVQLSGQTADAGLAAKGETRYNLFCVACHGADGSGNPALGAPDLSNDIWLYGGSREAITQSIATGRMGKMPAQKNLLTEEQMKLIAAYVTSLSN